MFFVNLRPYRVLLATALVLVLALAAGAVEISVTALADRSPLVQGTWGTGSGQFGLGRDVLGRSRGPSAIALDDRGRLYVADTYNCRVVRYGSDGARDGSWEARLDEQFRSADLAVDGGGRLFVAVAGGPWVLRFDSRGEFRGRDEAVPAGDAAGEWVLHGLWADRRAGFHVIVTGQAGDRRATRILRFDAEGRLAAVEAAWDLKAGTEPAGPQPQAALPEGFCVGARGELFAAFRDGPFDIRIERLGTGGKPLWSNRVAVETLIKASLLLGGNAKGAYVALDYGETAEVLLIPPRGAPVRLAAIPPFRPRADLSVQALPYTAVPGRVSSSGQLYLVASSADRFAVGRFTLRSVPRLRWFGGRPVLEVEPCR